MGFSVTHAELCSEPQDDRVNSSLCLAHRLLREEDRTRDGTEKLAIPGRLRVWLLLPSAQAVQQ